MRLATLRTAEGTRAVRIDGDAAIHAGSASLTATPIEGFADLGELLQMKDWRLIAEHANAPSVSFYKTDLEAVIPAPKKIVCVGLNYANHIKEMGRERPDHPTLFVKFPDALTGPFDDIRIPNYASGAVDWEGEMAVIIGKRAHRVSASEAQDYIAGYAVMNDCSTRDYQYRTLQWHQGKSFEKSAGFGPWMTTTDDFTFGGELATYVDGEKMQTTPTDDLVFKPTDLIEYISHIYPLDPGDVIVTGTPGGVGHARDPRRYVRDGETVTIGIEGLGEISNRFIFG